MTKIRNGFLLSLLSLVLLPGLALAETGVEDPINESIEKLPQVFLEGLEDSVRVFRNENNVPHIFALNDHDAAFMQGWVHASDRFFQMDVQRRTFSGTLAELVGQAALGSDVQFRTLGLRRAAEAALPLFSNSTMIWLEGYAKGVNAWLAANPLPPEYAGLALTTAQEWSVGDSLVIAKALAFGLSFDLDDLDRTEALLTFDIAGQLLGFDGTALFSQDLYRSAPFDPSVSIPDFLANIGAAELDEKAHALPKKMPSYLGAHTLALVREARQRLDAVPALETARNRADADVGSNWWVAGPNITTNGNALLANDPHLGLDAPSIFYEMQLRVSRKTGSRPLNTFGVTFAGVPGMVQGCNPWICWGSTVNPMDVTDLYLEELVFDPVLGVPVATVFDGQPEPLLPIPQSFAANALDPSQPDTVVPVPVPADQGGVTLVVPRRNNGPILQIAPNPADPDEIVGLSVQYTGFAPTRELDAFMTWMRSTNLDRFVDGLQFFDVGSQNWSYADVDGNIAYFTSAEMPIREDLQTLNAPDGGIPPWFVRDGSNSLAHEWMAVQNPQPQQSLPFEVLPFDEMPQVTNPANSYILNCNNDPVGTTLDNNPLNQIRPGGGLYYLNPGYASGFRQGRLTRLFEATDGLFSKETFKEYQSNNQLLDAEILSPYILAAWDAAAADGANPALAAFLADAGVAEAMNRLAAWDYSTPTGIREGYDPGDDPANLPEPTDEEIAASVAATIYSTWRGRMLANTIDATLEGIAAFLPAELNVAAFRPGSALSMSALRNLLDNYDTMGGVGASGVDFFNVPGIDDAEVERDFLLLQSVRDALDLLASDEFAAAFNNSTAQDDYRWGYLHRIVFDHPLGGPFDIPNGVGLSNLSDELPGIPRSGGFGALDASSHSARASGVNSFMFGSGPARRFVGEMTSTGPDAHQVTPGGASGVLGSPYQTDQLMDWLTNNYHPLRYRPQNVSGNARTAQIFFPMP